MNSEYKNLNTLLQALSAGVNTLESGNLSLEKLDALLQDAREFHERIAILQYLSARPQQDVKKEVTKKKKIIEGLNFSFDFQEKEKNSTNQTNLLDAIEDIPAIKKILPTKEETTTKNQTIEEPDIVESIEKTTPPEVEETQKTRTKEEGLKNNSGSVNDQFSEQADLETIAEKLGKSAIPNLIEAIGLNQKFLFMNDLFEGENNLYKEAINNLNNYPNFIAADEYLNTLKSRHNWDTTHETVKKFEELVARRYC